MAAEKLLGRPVKFLPDCVGKEVEDYCSQMKPGEIILILFSFLLIDFFRRGCRPFGESSLPC